MGVERLAGAGVHPDGDVLARAHLGELGFLEVRRHPQVVGHDGQQGLAGVDVVADVDGALCDAAVLRGVDGRVAEVELGRGDGHVGGLQVGGGGLDGAALRLELGLGGGDGLLVRLDGRGGGAGLGVGVVHGLPGHGAGIDGLVALEVGLLLGQVGLRDADLGLGLVDVGLTELQVGLRLVELGHCLGALGAGVVEAHLVVAGVELQDDLALPDLLVVAHVEGADLGGDLSRDLGHVAVDEGVVRGFELAGVEPVRDGGGGQEREDDEADEGVERLLPARRRLLFGGALSVALVAVVLLVFGLVFGLRVGCLALVLAVLVLAALLVVPGRCGVGAGDHALRLAEVGGNGGGVAPAFPEPGRRAPRACVTIHAGSSITRRRNRAERGHPTQERTIVLVPCRRNSSRHGVVTPMAVTTPWCCYDRSESG